MNDYRQGPDYRALRMARFLQSLDTTHAISLPADIASAAHEILQWNASIISEGERLRNAVIAKAAATQSVKDADVPLDGTTRCDHHVFRGSRDFRGGRCDKAAKWLRTWTTRSFGGFSLDGKVLEMVGGEYVVEGGWEIGKGFTTRPLTEEEEARRVRIIDEQTHTASLCGTHRNKRGEYGLPY